MGTTGPWLTEDSVRPVHRVVPLATQRESAAVVYRVTTSSRAIVWHVRPIVLVAVTGLPAQLAPRVFWCLICVFFALTRLIRDQRGALPVWQLIISSVAVSVQILISWMPMECVSYALRTFLEPFAAQTRTLPLNVYMTTTPH